MIHLDVVWWLAQATLLPQLQEYISRDVVTALGPAHTLASSLAVSVHLCDAGQSPGVQEGEYQLEEFYRQPS